MLGSLSLKHLDISQCDWIEYMPAQLFDPAGQVQSRLTLQALWRIATAAVSLTRVSVAPQLTASLNSLTLSTESDVLPDCLRHLKLQSLDLAWCGHPTRWPESPRIVMRCTRSSIEWP